MTDSTLEFARKCLSCVSVELPHLSGLAHEVELRVDLRVATAAVTPSGRVLLNPEWFPSLSLREGVFVMAHELLHLALGHHRRLDFAQNRRVSNVVADAVINDMLVWELNMSVPCGGVQVPGARSRSSEELLLLCRKNEISEDRPAWDFRAKNSPRDAGEDTALQRSLRKAGLAPEQRVELNPELVYQDLLPAELEREWFPEAERSKEARTERLKIAMERVAALGVAKQVLGPILAKWDRGRQRSGSLYEGYQNALETTYQPPWEMALQRWLDDCAPSQRSWSRPSRRQGARRDIVLPGRARQGWTLNIVLDTSGSMVETHRRLLGVIASFCRGQGIDEVRILQCDTVVTKDERVAPSALAHYQIRGYGGSNMSPAMKRFAEDPHVESVLVLTDGAISYPETVPYRVFWALTGQRMGFQPPYGLVVKAEGL